MPTRLTASLAAGARPPASPEAQPDRTAPDFWPQIMIAPWDTCGRGKRPQASSQCSHRLDDLNISLPYETTAVGDKSASAVSKNYSISHFSTNKLQRLPFYKHFRRRVHAELIAFDECRLLIGASASVICLQTFWP